MSDSIDALDAEKAVEAKLAETGADNIRRVSFAETPETAPTEDTPDRARNELGQFTSTEDDGDQLELADTAPEPEQGDPAVAAFLAKYDGDIDAAIKGAAHQQSLMGKQAAEVGDLRRMVDELSALRETVQADYQQRQQQPAYMDQATVDWYDQQVMENPQQALAWAQQQNNPLLVARGLDVWKDIDPYGAAVYTNRLENQAMQAQFQQQLSRQAQLPLDATVNLALQNVRNRNPQFVGYDNALEATMQKHPFATQALQAAANSGDPAQIEGAIETLYSLAVGETLQAIDRIPQGGETNTADVAVPTVSETRDPAPEPTPVERFKEEFRQESERRRRGVWVAE